MTPTQLTLKHLREQGYLPWIVERNIPCRPPRKVDMYNIMDLIAIRLGETVGIQVTDGSHFAEHDRKILESEYGLRWLQAGNRLCLYGWRKLLVKRGKKATYWEPRIKYYSELDFPPNNDSVPF